MIAGITGAHWLIYSKNPEADRAFFRDVLGFRAVDAGGGWLIFALPPSELAVHPVEGLFVQQHADHDLMGAVMYLMCDDVRASMKSLEAHNVRCAAIAEAELVIKELQSANRFGGRPIVTQLEPAKTFWPAEEYHQDFIEKTGRACHVTNPWNRSEP